MIYDKLYDFQKKIVDKFKDRSAFGLFVDMGLGKTPTSLALAEANNCTKIIIVTINSKALEDESINGSWLSWGSISPFKFSFHNKYTLPKKLQAASISQDSHDLLILNYEALFKRKDKVRNVELRPELNEFINLCQNNNVALIIDESHKMKNLQSTQTKSLMLMKKMLQIKAKNVYTYLLTGTPFTKGYEDLYAQLKMLGCNMTKGAFTDAYCVRGNVPGLLGWQQPIVGYKNIKELYNLIHRYAITIKSEDVVDLPEKLEVYHTSNLSHPFCMYVNEQISGKEINKELESRKEEQQECYNVEKRVNNPYFRNIAWPDWKWLAETNGTFWLRARQLSIGFQGNAEESMWFDKRRLNQLRDFLENNEDNYLIFYNFTPELFEIFNICDELGYNVDVYCGEIKSLRYYEKYSRLTEAEKLTNKKNVIIANFASGATGMNWQEYNKGIIFSIPLFKDYEQGTKRIHRLGQKETVIWHIFYQKNWLDYSMMKALQQQIDYSVKMFEADLNKRDILESLAKSNN